MAYCIHCGMEIPDNSKFCTNCGAPQESVPQTPPPQPQQNIYNTPHDSFASQQTGQDFFGGQQNSFGGQQSSFGGQQTDQYSRPDYNSSHTGSSYGGGSPFSEKPTLTFAEAVQTCFSKYATFSGRARRSEYWYFSLFCILVSFALGVVGNMIFGTPENGGNNMLQSIFSIAVLIPSLSVSWRRLHDIGKSGAWWLLNLIPLIGQIILIYFACKDSEPGENQYGMSPKYPLR